LESPYYLTLSAHRDAVLRQRAAFQQAHGVPVAHLDPDAVRVRFPYLRADDMHGATFCAADGYLMPSLLLAAYLEQARGAGAQIAEGVPVTGIRITSGRVVGVETTAGMFAAPRIVDAAGPWSAQIGALADPEVPVVPLKRQVWLTEPTTAAPATAPLTIDSATGRHVRPREGALLFAMPGGEHPGDERLALDAALAERMLAPARIACRRSRKGWRVVGPGCTKSRPMCIRSSAWPAPWRASTLPVAFPATG
jgi:sarcosine oxidase subunit beta